MPRARSLAIALTAAALAAPSAVLAQGSSGAGDDQYADPFEGGTEQTTSGAGSTGGGEPEESQDPTVGGGSDTTGTGTSTSPAETTAATSGAQPTGATAAATGGSLPNTGTDPRLTILAGLALLLSGLGLRLRTADEDR